MNTWIYKQTITTPTGSQIDEIECPRCGYRETVPRRYLFRPSSCYVCGAELDLDDFFKETIIRRLTD